MNALHDALLVWLRTLTHEKKASPNTVEAYARDVRQVIAYFGEEIGTPSDLLALKPADLRLFLGERRTAGIGNRSIMRQLAGLRAFARHLEREGYGHASAFKAVKGPRVKKGLPRPLAPQDARATTSKTIRAGEDREPWIIARDAAVFALLYGAGLRISEAL
ncbi:MAG: site-specific integrase, partial [Rhabdaerophilum sp.]